MKERCPEGRKPQQQPYSMVYDASSSVISCEKVKCAGVDCETLLRSMCKFVIYLLMLVPVETAPAEDLML